MSLFEGHPTSTTSLGQLVTRLRELAGEWDQIAANGELTGLKVSDFDRQVRGAVCRTWAAAANDLRAVLDTTPGGNGG